MRIATRTLAVLIAISLGARAEGRGSASHGGGGAGTGLVLLDLFLDFVTLAEVASYESAVAHAPPPPDNYEQRMPSGPEDDPRFRPRRYAQAREGLLLSFGVGGGSMYLSDPTFGGRTGAFDIDLRLGYGFSDRFQFFMDMDVGAASYRNAPGTVYYGSNEVASWTFTFRGQTVLVGDRAGNGLNLNFGVGLGGISYNNGDGSYYGGYGNQSSSATGLALAGGLSYDARLSPWFSLSPEFFWTWHEVPGDPGTHDVANIYGLRLNFLWYLK